MLVEFDAVILAGGRSARLGGVPKSSLKYDGVTLLERALHAASGATKIVVVGPDPGNLPPGTLVAREDPPFAGPAAAIAAGLQSLRDSPDRPQGTPPWTLVLACDMPHSAAAVRALLAALEATPDVDGVLAASDDGRQQPLAGVYSTSALAREAGAASARGELTNSPVFRLLARLELLPVHVPAHSTDDVDSWDDAAALGVSRDSP